MLYHSRCAFLFSFTDSIVLDDGNIFSLKQGIWHESGSIVDQPVHWRPHLQRLNPFMRCGLGGVSADLSARTCILECYRRFKRNSTFVHARLSRTSRALHFSYLGWSIRTQRRQPLGMFVSKVWSPRAKEVVVSYHLYFMCTVLDFVISYLWY